MPLNHRISMEYKPADGTHARTPIVFTRWEHGNVIQFSGNFRRKEMAENSGKAGSNVFEKAEGYKNRTRLGSRPGLTLSLLHSKLTFFKPALSKSPICPSLS